MSGRTKVGSCSFRNERGVEVTLCATRADGFVRITDDHEPPQLNHKLTELEACKLVALLTFLLHDDRPAVANGAAYAT